jgi:hypothetical protein
MLSLDEPGPEKRMDRQEDMARARSVWYRADDVDGWARLAHNEILRLRDALDDATRQALGAEEQLELLTAAERTIAGEADRSLGATARAGAATDSAPVHRACEAADELVVEALRRALDALAQIRSWIGDLYNWGWPLRTEGSGRSEWGKPGDALSRLHEVLADGIESSAPAQDSPADARGIPRRVRPVPTNPIRWDVIDPTARTDEPDAPGDQSDEVDLVLAEARQGALRIAATARKVLTASFERAESDLLAASADRDEPGAQSA